MINTLAVILRGQSGGPFYLHAYDGWLEADTLDGTWRRVGQPMPEFDGIAEQVARHVAVDLLNGPGALGVVQFPGLAQRFPDHT